MVFFQKKRIAAEIQEELSPTPLKVQGQIPSWLSGTLIRNGPINVTIDDQTNGHWFDGLAMLHAFSFSKGEVSYANQFLRTHAYSQVFDKGSLDYDGFAVDPCRSLFQQLLTYFIPQSESYLHNANVNVAKIADHYIALTETPLPVEFDPTTLDTLGVLKYQDKLPKKGSWESAHPHYLSEDKKIVNYCIQYGPQSHYLIYCLDEAKIARELISKIPVQNPAYMHSFAMTENYVILTEFPFTVKPLQLLLNYKIKGRSFIKNFSWHPETGTTFIVIHRHTGQCVGKYKTKPFFAFHHANAYEMDNDIYLDLVCYNNADIIPGLAFHFRPPSCIHEDQYPTRLERFQLSLNSGEIKSEILLNAYVEFPRINERKDGKFYKYLYLIDPRQEASKDDIRPVFKINMQTKQLLQWFEKGCYPGEPVFVANPHSEEEDEGVILTVVLDQTHHSSFLLVLDARTFQEIGRTALHHQIPVGLHGQYFAQ
jgi:beta,beta-carotene 9',10'-dioxygenase